ncbi:hypothetical protein DSUL_20414 [Desulfovibrionales bacterium]
MLKITDTNFHNQSFILTIPLTSTSYHSAPPHYAAPTYNCYHYYELSITAYNHINSE